MSKAMILIADTGENLQTEKMILEQRGHDVISAESAEKAAKLMKSRHPDLLIFDTSVIGGKRYLELCTECEYLFPVIFLSADRNDETACLLAGAADFIAKPADQNVFDRRVCNTIENIIGDIDTETGLPGFETVSRQIHHMCSTGSGVLIMAELDNLPLIEEIHGKETREKVLAYFGEKLLEMTNGTECVGRTGENLFVICSRSKNSVHSINSVTAELNKILSSALEEIADDVEQIAGASVGAVFFPEDGSDLGTLYAKASETLGSLRQKGKRGYSIYSGSTVPTKYRDTLETLEKNLRERNVSNGAYRISIDELKQVYPYFMRYIDRYCESAFKVLFTLVPKLGNPGTVYETAEFFGEMIASQLRKSDILVHTQQNQLFLILPDVSRTDFEMLISRILKPWYASDEANETDLLYESKQIVDKTSNK